MRDILPDIDRWLEAGEAVALATVVETWGSAPRSPGGKMAATASGRIAGSVSGGCVEGAVVEACRETLRTGRPRLLRFGVADETAWSVGLACGGTVEVFVERLDPDFYARARREILSGRTFGSAVAISGPEEDLGRRFASGEPPRDRLGESAAAALREIVAEGRSRRVAAGGAELFVDVERPAPTLVVVGGVHIAIPLVALARSLGFRTVVVDPRESFANPDRFPTADRLVLLWPDRALAEIGVDDSTAIAVLTHDPKLDDPALTAGLASRAFYVGALGSRRTQQKRRERLLAAGVPEERLARLRAPIGLPLGGRSPEEIALAILAEIVAVRNGVTPGGAAIPAGSAPREASGAAASGGGTPPPSARS